MYWWEGRALGEDVGDGSLEEGASGEGEEHASSLSAKGVEFREKARGDARAFQNDSSIWFC